MATANLHAPKPKSSTTTLTATDNVTEIVFRADVQGKGGSGSPTGSVVFKDGATVIGTVQLGGELTMTTGPQTVTAIYGGDAQYTPSTSQTLTAPFV